MEAGPQRLKGASYRETRSAVLDLIRSSNGVSRVELARRSGLTEGTISKIVKDLLGGGVIMTAGAAESTGGKRATLLRLNRSAHHALGITLDVSTTVIVLCGLDGTPLAERRIPGYGSEAPERAIERVAVAAEALLSENQVGKNSVVGVGLASSGRRQGSRGWGADAAVAISWEERFDLAGALGGHLGLPVKVENDANCAALGVYWSGGENSPRTFMTVYMASGIGAGFVIGGSLYRGASGNAGEIGHIVVEPDGPACWCGSRGCLDTLATPGAITKRVCADPGLRRTFDVDEQTGPALVWEHVLAALGDGSAEALALVEASARQVATVVLGLCNTFDLDSVSLAGPGFGSAGEVYLREVRAALGHSSVARGLHPIDVRFAGGGQEVAALGAASVVLHSRLTPHHELSSRW